MLSCPTGKRCSLASEGFAFIDAHQRHSQHKAASVTIPRQAALLRQTSRVGLAHGPALGGCSRADFWSRRGAQTSPNSRQTPFVGRQRQSQRKGACGSHQPRPLPPVRPECTRWPLTGSWRVSPHDTRWQRCCRVFFVLRRTVSYQPPKCNIRLTSQKSIFGSRSGRRGRFRWSGAPCFSCQASKTFAARSGNGGLSKASPEASWDSRRASDDSRAGSSGAIFIRRRASHEGHCADDPAEPECTAVAIQESSRLQALARGLRAEPDVCRGISVSASGAGKAGAGSAHARTTGKSSRVGLSGTP